MLPAKGQFAGTGKLSGSGKAQCVIDRQIDPCREGKWQDDWQIDPCRYADWQDAVVLVHTGKGFNLTDRQIDRQIDRQVRRVRDLGERSLTGAVSLRSSRTRKRIRGCTECGDYSQQRVHDELGSA